MDFGAFILCQRLQRELSTTEVFDNSLELVQLAEKVGFRNAWFPEHHLLHYVSCPSPLMMAVKAASVTNSIRVGTAITVAPYYHPIRLAGEIGMADHLTNGRLEIGTGRGAVNYEFTRFGIDVPTASARFQEAAKTVQNLLANEDCSSDGPTWPFPESTTVPRPLQDPFPPMWVAARSPETIDWSVKNGFNVMTNTPWGEPLAAIESVGKQFQASVDAANPAVRPKFGVSRVAFVAETDDEARAEMEAVQTSNRVFTRLFRDMAQISGGFAEPAPVEGEPTPDELFDVLIAGSPKTCIEKLKYLEGVGVDHFIMFVFGKDHESTMRSVRLFGEKVIPAFRND
ncbi:MAG: LLM class flavin-dependent oxidoreductase [Proteobacteria bacterium]|nr:MAG: LLM class flavin-dependent oxidoreductase [Pseudomonadota bacterium]